MLWLPKDNYLGLALAVIASVLGLYNLWRSIKIERDRRFEQLAVDRTKWADEAIDCMSSLQSAAHDPSYENRRKSLREISAKLTGIIDKGKLRFPNDNPAEFGVEKGAAYAGFRQQALNNLNAVDQLIRNFFAGNLDKVTQSHPLDLKQIIHHKREFVSCIQSALEVRRRVDIALMSSSKRQFKL